MSNQVLNMIDPTDSYTTYDRDTVSPDAVEWMDRVFAGAADEIKIDPVAFRIAAVCWCAKIYSGDCRKLLEQVTLGGTLTAVNES